MDAVLVSCDGWRGSQVGLHAHHQGNPAALFHYAAMVDGQVIDYTARQFDRDHPVPRLTTVEQLRTEWDRVRELHPDNPSWRFWGHPSME